MNPNAVAKTIETGVRVGIPAGVLVVTSEVLLNRTSLSEGKKTAAVAVTMTAVGIGLAGYAPTIAAGAIVAAVVYGSQSAARKTRLDRRVDQLLSEKRAAAQQAASQQVNQQQNQGTPPANNTNVPAGRLPAPNQRAGYVQRNGQFVRVDR